MNGYWIGITILIVLLAGLAVSNTIRMLASSTAPTEDPGQRAVEVPSVDYRAYVASKLAHLERGQLLGPPEDREPHPLDEVIEAVISALRSETRMYPEVYAWIIADAVSCASPPFPTGWQPDEQPASVKTPEQVIDSALKHHRGRYEAVNEITASLVASDLRWHGWLPPEPHAEAEAAGS